MTSLDQECDELCKKSEIECIFYDGRIDATKMMFQERRAGGQKIIDFRGADDDVLGDFSVCARKPLINARASTLLELIDWSEGVYEPPLMCKLTIVEIKKFIDEPMQVPQRLENRGKQS
ncbi:hypothetical protein E2320_019886 [Naja naja]|nr:hypothetical protein E2320_019886 [Naja naja]